MIEPTNALDVAQPAQVELEILQHKSFSYFLHETNPDNGLVIDKTAADWPASICATGFALGAFPGCGGGRTNATHFAFLLKQPARPRPRRHRLPWFLLSFPRHADRPRQYWQANP